MSDNVKVFVGMGILVAFPLVLIATAMASWHFYRARKSMACLMIGLAGLVVLISIGYVYNTHVAGVMAGVKH